MNNVITILIDSMNTKSLGTQKTTISSTPFIDKLAKSGMLADNIYSYGPYTDAATKGLFCGNKTLDDYGYYFGINSSKYNHYKIFKENGYETYGFFYPYYLISSSKQNDIDHRIYTSGFVFSSVWFGKFLFYQDIKKKRTLSSDEYMVLERCLSLVFDCWISFYNDLLKEKNADNLLKQLIKNVDINNCLLEIKKEYQMYEHNKEQYIDELLEKGMEHRLAKLDKIDIDALSNRSFIKEKVYKKHHCFFKKIDKMTKKLNKKNNPFDKKLFKQSVKNVLFKRDRGSLRYLANCYLSRNTVKYQKRNTFKPFWQYESSTMSQFNCLMNILDERKNTERPFYAFLHLEEPHERISFFSYDINDESLIDNEILTLNETVDGIGDDFKGSIIYQLSLRYVDMCIEKLFGYLKNKNLLDNTTVLITADHGSSYSYYPIRKEVVNCFYRENYNVPLVIWQNNFANPGKVYNKMYQSRDVLPTLIDIVGISKPSELLGNSIIKNEQGEDTIITEYMGPGCPDMITRDVWMSIRNSNYLLAFKIPINQDFNYKYLCEAYNLQNDPNELINISNEIDFNSVEITTMIEKLKNRFIEIKLSKELYLEKLRNNQIIL